MLLTKISGTLGSLAAAKATRRLCLVVVLAGVSRYAKRKEEKASEKKRRRVQDDGIARGTFLWTEEMLLCRCLGPSGECASVLCNDSLIYLAR